MRPSQVNGLTSNALNFQSAGYNLVGNGGAINGDGISVAPRRRSASSAQAIKSAPPLIQ